MYQSTKEMKKKACLPGYENFPMLGNFSCSGGKKRKYVTRQTMEVIIQ
jgi:hypothetical protein